MSAQKAFDQWNTLKKRIDAKQPNRNIFFYEREVWWSSLGINVGVEIDGKNEYFERPVVIVKKFNGHMLWVVPLTSKYRDGPYFLEVHHRRGLSFACIAQLRVISSKRLLWKIGSIRKSEFTAVCKRIANLLYKKGPPDPMESSRPKPLIPEEYSK